MCALVNATHAFFAFLSCGCAFKRAAWCLSLVLSFHRKRKEKSFVDVHSYILHVSVTEFRKWTRSFFSPELSRTILYLHETALTSVRLRARQRRSPWEMELESMSATGEESSDDCPKVCSWFVCRSHLCARSWEVVSTSKKKLNLKTNTKFE